MPAIADDDFELVQPPVDDDFEVLSAPKQDDDFEVLSHPVSSQFQLPPDYDKPPRFETSADYGLSNDSDLLRTGGNAVIHLPETAGKYALATAADAAGAIPALINNDEGAVGNLRAAVKGEELPITARTREMSQDHPVLATTSKVAQGLAASAPYFALGALPAAAGRLASAGFAVDMIGNAGNSATVLGDEMGKPPEQRNLDRLTTAVSDLAQAGVFAPMTGLHAINPKTVAAQLKDVPLGADFPDRTITPETTGPKADDFEVLKLPTEMRQQASTEVKQGGGDQKNTTGPESEVLDALKANRVEPKAAPLATLNDAIGAKLDEIKALLSGNAPKDATPPVKDGNAELMPPSDLKQTPFDTSNMSPEELDRHNRFIEGFFGPDAIDARSDEKALPAPAATPSTIDADIAREKELSGRMNDIQDNHLDELMDADHPITKEHTRLFGEMEDLKEKYQGRKPSDVAKENALAEIPPPNSANVEPTPENPSEVSEAPPAEDKAGKQSLFEPPRNDDVERESAIKSIRNKEIPISDSRLFDRAQVRLSRSGQSNSIYTQVLLDPKSYDIAKEIEKRGSYGNGNVYSSDAGEFSENKDLPDFKFNDAVPVDIRISDHPATESAKSEPDIDIRIGKDRKQKKDGTPDTPDYRFNSWQDAMDNLVDIARKFNGDKAGQQSLFEGAKSSRNDTPQPLRDAIQRGTTVRGILTHLSVSDHPLADLATNLLRNGDEASLRIKAMVKAGLDRSRWTTEGGNERIEFAPDAPADSLRVLHEIVHALTATKGARYKPLLDLMNQAMEHLDPNEYAFTDKQGREFIAEAMSNPDFQAKLEAIKVGPTTAWAKFKNIVQRLIGIAPKNATLLDEVLKASHEIVKAPREERGGTLNEPDESVREKAIRVAQDLRAGLVPAAVDAQAGQMGGILREHTAALARTAYRYADAFKSAGKMFDKTSPAENLKFIDRMENGAKQPTPELQRVADALKAGMDVRVKEVQALGTGKLDTLIENYFPHIWTPDSIAKLKGKTIPAQNAWSRVFSRRPMEGSKAFTKQRSIPTTREGVALGLEPVSHNPVELALLKYHEMDKYIMAQRVLSEMKDQGLAKGANQGQQPEGWKQLNDSMFNYKYVATVDGKPQAMIGHYYAPEPVARVLNNYLSPGLAGYPIYDLFRGAGNALNMAQLGLSAYHLTFTGIDSATSKLALGIEQMSRGNILRGAGNVVKGAAGSIVVNPIENYLRGSKVLKEYTAPGSVGGETADIVNSLIKGGGRVSMDAFYKGSSAAKFLKAWREGDKLGVAKNALGAAAHGMSYPIMQVLVPRMKLGIFADMARYELEKNPTADGRKVMAKVWDSVDNRMGQMVYDNLFWNKVLKDTAMASVRSVGWNLGTIRELGGSAVDSATILKRLKAGDPAVTHRMAYAMALPIVVGTMGAMYQYLRTGKGPDDMKDYFMPRTGNKNADGSPERIILPSYMKDMLPLAVAAKNKGVTGVADRGVQMALNKAQPLIAAISQMWQNKDFYGTQIVNHDDPIVKEAMDYAKYIGGQFVPFSARNFANMDNPDVPQVLSSFFGLQKPTAELTRTKAMQRMADYYAAQQSIGGKTQEQTEVYNLRRDLLGKMQKGDDVSSTIRQDQIAGKLTPAQAKTLMNLNGHRNTENALDGRVLAFKHLPYPTAQTVFDLGTNEEQSLWKFELGKKKASYNKTH